MNTCRLWCEFTVWTRFNFIKKKSWLVEETSVWWPGKWSYVWEWKGVITSVSTLTVWRKTSAFCEFMLKFWRCEENKNLNLHLSDSDDHSSFQHRVGLEGGVGRAWVYPWSNCSFWLPLKQKLLSPTFSLTLQSWLLPAALTSSMFVFFSFFSCVCGCDWYVTEAEKHCRSTGFLDGQRLRAAQLYQAGPRSESHHTGRPRHPRPPCPDGFQVSLSVTVRWDVCWVVLEYCVVKVLQIYSRQGTWGNL